MGFLVDPFYKLIWDPLLDYRILYWTVLWSRAIQLTVVYQDHNYLKVLNFLFDPLEKNFFNQWGPIVPFYGVDESSSSALLCYKAKVWPIAIKRQVELPNFLSGSHKWGNLEIRTVPWPAVLRPKFYKNWTQHKTKKCRFNPSLKSLYI